MPRRSQLSEEFLSGLLRQYRRGGEKAIGRVMATRPEAFIKVLALLVPKEMHVTQESAIESMTTEQLAEAIATLRAYLDRPKLPPMIDVLPGREAQPRLKRPGVI
jgi:hypothetical protein